MKKVINWLFYVKSVFSSALREILKNVKYALRVNSIFKTHFFFLAGASMDGIFNNCGVEVKCPSSLMNADLNKLTEKQLKKHFCEKKNGKMVLKRDHKFFVQVQTQMFVSGFKSTYFVV